MSLQFLKPAFVCLMLVIGIPYTAQVQAHGGLSLADDVCKLTIGPYTMHFTGYQPDSTQEKEFCEDIPATGRTVVALDYIEEALRPLRTEVGLISPPPPPPPGRAAWTGRTEKPGCHYHPARSAQGLPQRLHQFRIPVCPARQIRRPRHRG